MATLSTATFAQNAAGVAAGSTLTITPEKHRGKTILLDTAAGSTVTLPAASGTGDIYRFVVSVIATSNSHIIKVVGDDVMQGIILTHSDNAADAVIGWRTADDSDTITLNRTTTGSVERGEWIELIDAAADLWLVRGVTAATGTEATPFSATVS